MDEPVNWEALTGGLGKDWQVANNSIKPYPAGFVIHPLLDLALDWRRANPERRRREGPCARQSAAAAAHRPARRRRPAARARSACSTASPPRWCWARRGSTSSPMPASTIRRCRRCGGGSRSPVRPACRPSRRRWISSRPTAGRTLSRPHAARGSAANPLKDSEIEDKLRIEAASWKPGHDIQPLIDAVWALDKSDDASSLAALAV